MTPPPLGGHCHLFLPFFYIGASLIPIYPCYVWSFTLHLTSKSRNYSSPIMRTWLLCTFHCPSCLWSLLVGLFCGPISLPDGAKVWMPTLWRYQGGAISFRVVNCNVIVSVHCREEGCIGKYIPRGPRDFLRAGILHPEAWEFARGRSPMAILRAEE